MLPLVIFLCVLGGLALVFVLVTYINKRADGNLKALEAEAREGRLAKKALNNIENLVIDHKTVSPGDSLLASMILSELRQNRMLDG